MQLTKWTPLANELGRHRFFDQVFDDFFAPNIRREKRLTDNIWTPAVDIYDEGDHTVIKADLPGVEKQDIEVSMEGRILILKGTRSADKEVKKENYYRQEIFAGSFQRSFTVREGIDQEKIEAEYKDGVLKLRIPKPVENQPKKIVVH